MVRSSDAAVRRTAPKQHPTSGRAQRAEARKRAARRAQLQWWATMSGALIFLALAAVAFSTFYEGSGIRVRGHF